MMEIDDSNGTISSEDHGTLPKSVAGILLITAICIVIGMGSSAGKPTNSIVLITVGGALAGTGVRIATRKTISRTVIGILLIWTAGVTVTAGGPEITPEQSVPITSPDYIADVLLIVGCLLTPFGLISSTAKSDIDDTTNTLLKQSLIGVVILIISITTAGILGLSNIPVNITGNLPVSRSLSIGVFPSPYNAIIITGAIYYITISQLKQLPGIMPYEILGTPDELQKYAESEKRYRRVCTTIGKAIIAVAGVLIITALVGWLTEYSVGGYLALIVNIGQFTPVLLISVTISILILTIRVGLYAINELATIDAKYMLETFIPPVFMSLCIVCALTIIDNPARILLTKSQAQSLSTRGPEGTEIANLYPELLIIAFSIFGIIITVFILSIPPLLNNVAIEDAALSGVVATIVGVLLVTISTVYISTDTFWIVAGVATMAFIWEVGEYLTVASRELQTTIGGEISVSGFQYMTLLHTTVAVIITISAIGTALMLESAAQQITITQSAGPLILIGLTIGFGLLATVLSG